MTIANNLQLIFLLTNIIWTLADDVMFSMASRPEQIIELPFSSAVRLFEDRMEELATSEIFRVVELIVVEKVVSWPPTWKSLILCGICCRGNLILHIIKGASVLQFTASDPPGHTYNIPVGSRFTDGVAENNNNNVQYLICCTILHPLYLDCHMYWSWEESTMSKRLLWMQTSFEFVF